MLKRIIILILLFSANMAFAQERLSLDDAIARALQHNFDIQVAQVNAEQAARNNTMGNAGMSPNINANGSVNAGRTDSKIEFADGRIQDVKNAPSFSQNGNVTLNWTLFDGGRMFILKKQLGELERIGEVQLKEQIQATVSQTIQAYAQAVWQQQQGVAIDTGLALARLRMVLSQLKYETGTSAKVDYLQARVDYNTRQSDSLNQQAALTTALANLSMLMGEKEEQNYILDDSLGVNTSMQSTNAELLEDINLTLDIAKRTAYVSQLNKRIARTYHLPVLTMNGAYNRQYSESGSGFAINNRSSGPAGGLSLSLPLFQGGNIRRQAKVAGLQAIRDELLYGRQSTELSRQYRTAWFNYKTSVSAYNLESENILYARENMEIQKARFRVGVGNTLEMREAENSYVQALLRYYTSTYNLKINETKVLELEGELVK